MTKETLDTIETASMTYPKKKYEKWEFEGGMTAKISTEYISLKPKQGSLGQKRQDFHFLKSKGEVVELVAKQMLEVVSLQRKLIFEAEPNY